MPAAIDPQAPTAAAPRPAPAGKTAASGPAPGEPLLSVRGLEVQFPTRRRTLTALQDISFDVMPGEILGVVGESGAGKSMTGNAIIGLLEPPGRITHGEVRFLGQDLTRLDAAALRRIRGRDIGAIFQDPLTSLNPLYRIGDMLVETLQTHLPLSTAEAQQRAIAMLGEVGIPAAHERFHHYPHQFSGGMRQRVVIALALCTEPRLVIADEPTTALDVSVQAQIINLLKRLCRERGTAVILVTHDMGVIAETADRVCVMYAGRIVEIGPVRTVIRDPRHPYTRGLMAAIPHIGGDTEQLAQIDGSMPRLDAIPPGCAFHPRCPQRFAPCTGRVPPLLEVERGHSAACYLYQSQGRP
jgi:peptide/nickel transport system ATP-binding protein